MKKTLLLSLCLATIATNAKADETIEILDLTRSTTPLEFNVENGSWVGTYDDDEDMIESQCFEFLKSSMGNYKTWWGFTASNSVDNTNYTQGFLDHQWSNMALGGIVLDENNKVKLDEHGAPVVSKDVPYLVAYYGAFMSRRPTDMLMKDGKTYEPQSVYINLNTYAYYSTEYALAPARPFTNGDKFTLTIHGVKADNSENTVEVTLASYDNGDLTINRGWKLVDLTSLGEVNELYFTMASTDTGAYGMNTPGYFCLDKLSVKAKSSGTNSVATDTKTTLNYNRATRRLTVGNAEFTIIRNTSGQTVMSGDSNHFDLSNLPAGVYVVSAGDSTLKIAR